jgi:hypothetical protein
LPLRRNRLDREINYRALIVGAPDDDPNGADSGASFVVFGRTGSGVVQLSDIAAGSGGFVINGVSADDQLGISVHSAGDVNGDGLNDLIIGASYDDPNGSGSGASFVVFGKTGTAAVQLSAVEAGTGGFVINGMSAGDRSGFSVSSAGDVNGDGLDDLIVGAHNDDPNGSESGASFVVFGKTGTTAVQLSAVEAGIGGFVINGVSAGDELGRAVSSAGDVNGDGLDDLIVGAHFDDPNGASSGASFVVFGRTGTTAVQLSAIEAGTGAGFVINGVSASDVAGRAVSSAGDVNGDGLDDLIVGAAGADPNGAGSGASFVIFGKTGTGAVQLSAVEAGSGGFVINGVSANDNAGWSVSSAGDVNGDGLDDLIVGAAFDDPNGATSGASFVVFGKTGTGAVQLSDIEAGRGGFVIAGVSAGDRSGNVVSTAGDVNGDGFDDLIIGAPFDDPNGIDSGASFVVFGGDFSGAGTRIGTVGADSLTGTSAVDRIVAGTGNDTLVGGGGADVLYGGAGNDRITVADLTFARIDGGTGTDRLVLAGTGRSLNLTTFDNTSLLSIEQIDLGNTGNSLTLNRIELQRLSEATNTLRVFGGSADSLTLADSGWRANGTVTDSEGTFRIYINGNARLELQNGIAGTGLPSPAVELSTVEAGTGGFVINGVWPNDRSGWSVSSAGDVNGDGLDDLIIGAPYNDPNGSSSGASFVVFGRTGTTAVQLSTIAAGTGGFVINGVSADDRSGFSVSSAGDVNGDGLDDLLVGARYDDPNGSSSGASFVVFGKTGTSAVELSAVEAGTGGFVINGASGGDAAGSSVSSAGDVNGDGLDDLIIGARNDDPNGMSSGASFVVFGKTGTSAVELSAVEAGTGGFVMNGVSGGDLSGWSVSSAGDVNGDGLDDLIVGAPFDDPNGADSGASFVVFGRTGTTAIQLSAIQAGTGGFVINGVSANDLSGRSVSSAGDVNGDGLDDLIVGAASDDPNGSASGASFVVFGKTGTGTVQLSAIEAGNGGFVINGVSAGDISGWSVSSAGDVNGDGLDDLLIGAPDDDPNGSNSGASFVVFGKTGTAAVQLSAVATGSGGFVINGVSADDKAGSSVSSAGDVNGDGFDDLIIGALDDDPRGDSSGASFVVFGGDFTGAATQIGTVGADSLTGTTEVDRIVAGTGNDTLVGGGGAEVLYGGAGNDRITVADLSFARIDGGTGTDRLVLAGTGLTLDLTTFDNTSLLSIEQIDLGNTGNSLTLNQIELQRLSESTNTLRVFGGSTDRLTLADSGWSAAGTVTDSEGTFRIYTHGNARLELQNGIAGTGLPTPGVELSTVAAGTGGFVINGVAAGDLSGRAVRSAGDVNGDGLDDLIIGAPEDDPNGTNSGASFVVFGRTGTTAVQLSSIAAGTGGFVINGVSADDIAGYSVSSAGDVNGDGLDDLIVGAPYDDPNGSSSGASFVVFGKTGTTAVQLSAVAAGTGGFVINGISADDHSGRTVSSAGDVNGDGLDDLIVGARYDDPNGANSGASFVIFGKTATTAVQLSTVAAGTGGFVINGVSAGDNFGESVSSAGDVNGDGLDDLIIGAIYDDPNGANSGASFVVFGKTGTGVVQLSAIEAGTGGGFVINGVSAADGSGRSVSSAGDVNGDGLDDLIVGAAADDPNGSESGASFVVFGRTGTTAVQLSAVEAGTGGFVINGVSASDRSGYSVSSAGDVNGDGLDDLIVGALFDDPNGSASGASFVVFGKTGTAAVQLSAVEAGAGGFVINGVSANDRAGWSVSSAGDVNGDGFDDLLVGAPFDDPNGADSGASFVVFGGDFTGAATQIGTVGADSLIGTAAVDRIVAGTGNDTLVGGGGADVLYGGAGNDRISVADLSFARIDGGTGTDRLVLAGTGLTLDLTTFDNTSLLSIERIDLGGTGNSLILNQIELLRLTEGTNTLRVFGGSADRLTLADSGWSPAGTVTDSEGTFRIYTQGNARLELQNGIVGTGLPIPAVELSTVTAGTGGFVINGVSAGDLSGYTVSSAGDVNGDGLDDLIIGAPEDDPNGTDSGASFIVFGRTGTTAVQLSSIAAGTGGFVINGASVSDNSGWSVSSAGDVNGDGLDDVIIGARYDDPNGLNSGASFVVFGKTATTAVQLSAVAAGSGGFVINGVSAADLSGFSVSSAGDVNGDGLDDLIIGAPRDTPSGTNSGASFVVFGKTATTAVQLSTVSAGTGGFVINGASALDQSGRAVSSAGDVNGDGLDDLIVGAPYDDPNGTASGASFVVFGRTGTTAVQLTAIEAGTGGFVINGVSANDNAGWSVSSAGDVNGDGLDDLIIGAQDDDPNGSNSGASFVVFGKTGTGAVQLSAIEAGNGGFVINGASANDLSSYSVSSAGDVNGDGLDDLIIGAPFNDPNGSASGASYVVFGKTGTAAVELSTVAAGLGGFVINGVSADDNAGWSVSSAGDVNGDGFGDLIIGALDDDPNGASSGASFVVFGGDFTGAATQVGSTGADSLSGSSANDAIFAGLGNDTLSSGGGTDRLSGGAGADRFVVTNNAGTATILDFDGGEGDRIDLSAFGIASFASAQALMTAVGSGGHSTRIALDADTVVILDNVAPSAIVASHLIL